MTTHPKRNNKLFFINTAGACLLAVLAVIAWRLHSGLANAERALASELSLRQNLQKQLDDSLRRQKLETARLLRLQKNLHDINPRYQTNENHWNQVEALIARQKARETEAGVAPASSPTPRTPLRTANHSNIFPEFLDDPAYAALVKESLLSETRETLFEFMHATDLSDSDKFAQAERILSEARMSEMDVRAAATALGMDGFNDAVVEKLRADIDKQQEAALRALVGEDAYDKYKYSYFTGEKPNTGGLFFSADVLATRVSYSSEPMTETQTRQMRALIQAEVDAAQDKLENRRGYYDLLMTDDFNARAAKILTPAQMQGLRELQEEKSMHVELMEEAKKEPRNEKYKSRMPLS